MIYKEKIKCHNTKRYETTIKIYFSLVILTLIVGIIIMQARSFSPIGVITTIAGIIILFASMIFTDYIKNYFSYDIDVEYYYDSVQLSGKKLNETIYYSDVKDVQNYSFKRRQYCNKQYLYVSYQYILMIVLKNGKVITLYTYDEQDIDKFQYSLMYNLYIALKTGLPFETKNKNNYNGGKLKQIDIEGSLNEEALINESLLDKHTVPIKFEFEEKHLIISNNTSIYSINYLDIHAMFHTRTFMFYSEKNRLNDKALYFYPSYIKIVTYSGKNLVIRLSDKMERKYYLLSDNIPILIEEVNYRVNTYREQLLKQNVMYDEKTDSLELS